MALCNVAGSVLRSSCVLAVGSRYRRAFCASGRTALTDEHYGLTLAQANAVLAVINNARRMEDYRTYKGIGDRSAMLLTAARLKHNGNFTCLADVEKSVSNTFRKNRLIKIFQWIADSSDAEGLHRAPQRNEPYLVTAEDIWSPKPTFTKFAGSIISFSTQPSHIRWAELRLHERNCATLTGWHCEDLGVSSTGHPNLHNMYAAITKVLEKMPPDSLYVTRLEKLRRSTDIPIGRMMLEQRRWRVTALLYSQLQERHKMLLGATIPLPYFEGRPDVMKTYFQQQEGEEDGSTFDSQRLFALTERVLRGIGAQRYCNLSPCEWAVERLHEWRQRTMYGEEEKWHAYFMCRSLLYAVCFATTCIKASSDDVRVGN